MFRRSKDVAGKYLYRRRHTNNNTCMIIPNRTSCTTSFIRKYYVPLDFICVGSNQVVRNNAYIERVVGASSIHASHARHFSVDVIVSNSNTDDDDDDDDNNNNNNSVLQVEIRSYQWKANNLLEQVKTNRVQSRLVAQKVEELLLQFLSEYDNNILSDGPLALELLNTALSNCSSHKNERLIPRLFSLTCQVMIRSDYRNTSVATMNEVHRQLWRLLNGYEHYFATNDIRYNTHHVNDVCSYYIRHIVADANKKKRKLDYRKTKQLNQLIDRLAKLYRNPSVPLMTNPHIDDSVIMLLCNQRKPREAYELLRRRVEKKKTSLSSSSKDLLSFDPLVSSFTSIINGYAKISQPENALQVVEWMLSAQKEASVVPPPNVSCFNALLHAYAMAGGNDAGFKAEQTLEWMEQMCNETEQHLDTMPNDTSYNICINAWARSNHPDAPIRAENLLRRIISLDEAGTCSSNSNQVGPSEEAFTAVMNTWVNCINNNNNNNMKKKVNNEEVTDRVTIILDLMERISEEDSDRLTLSVIPYTVLIKAWEKTAQQRRGLERQKCGDKILQVVERMRANGVAPTTEVYNSILTALGEIAAINAVFYFLELEQQYCDGTIQLDTRTFNCGLNAIAALNRPDAVEKATGILKRMFKYYESDHYILPSTFTYNIILKVLSRSTSHIPDAAAKADDLLTEMDSMPSVTPDFISYVTCIIAWGRSHEKDKMKRVTNLLQKYISSLDEYNQDGNNNKSSIAVFNAVLSVCHHNLSPELRVESLETAQVTMIELRKVKGIADQITYSSFFRVVKEGGSPVDRPPTTSFLDLIEKEFIRCTSDGYIIRDILTAVYQVAPTTVFANLVGQNEDPRTFSIPKAWSRNV
jgi:hypothetical protein